MFKLLYFVIILKLLPQHKVSFVIVMHHGGPWWSMSLPAATIVMVEILFMHCDRA